MRPGAGAAPSLAGVWLLLAILTLMSVMLVERLQWRAAAVVSIFLIAGLKSELVAASYMEIGRSRTCWRVAYRLWILGVATVLAVAHLIR